MELTDGRVYASVTPLKIGVLPFKYDIGGLRGTFIGASEQSVTDDDTNYVYLDEDGDLTINTTGFPTTVGHLTLARVTAANGEIVAIHNERTLLASSAAVPGTCRIGFPVDGGIRGGNASTSANNGIASVTFDGTSGESRNRWNIRPPQNYTTGDLVFRCYASVSGSPGSNSARLGLSWQGLKDGESLPSGSTHDDYEYNDEDTVSLSAVSSDELFFFDLTIPAANFDKTDDLLALWFYRDADHAGDTTSLTLHTHICELRYTGYKVAGQAGQ